MKRKVNLPTKITITRIIIAVILLLSIIVLFILDQFSVINISNLDIKIGDNGHLFVVNLIIFGVFLFASFTDFLDGYIARKYNLVTDLGKFLDPIADKMLINGLMIFLIVGFTSTREVSINFPFFCAILMVVRDVIIDGLRIMAAQKDVVIAAGFFGKAKTVTQMVALSLILLNGFPFSFFDASWPQYVHITDFVTYLATAFSLISGIIYLTKYFYIFGGNKDE